MTNQQRLDFLAAFGQEFSESLFSSVGRDAIVPQDGYEVFVRGLGKEPTPGVLSRLSECQVELFRAECERYFECSEITAEQIRTAIARTLARYPNESETSTRSITATKLPMPLVYSARYKDNIGQERTTIQNDGQTLTMVVRGVCFQGNDFDGFEPMDAPDLTLLSSFKFLHGSLCFCVIEADIPVPVVTPTGIVDCLLTFELELGSPLPTGQMVSDRFKLFLMVNDQKYSSEGKTGWFEGEMLDLQRQLPSGTFMKACINCSFSDYSPYGHALFGTLICFRANKKGYLGLSLEEEFSKDAYFAVMDTVSEMVQETHLCPEFEKRVPGTGYRG